jgi:flagellar hook-length control protein FliK
LKGGEKMNVGAMLSMQNLGQITSENASQAVQQGGQGAHFSNFLTKAASSEETTEQMDSGIMNILRLFQTLSSEDVNVLEGSEESSLNMELLLSQTGSDRQELFAALESVLSQMINTVPELKEVLPGLNDENLEESLFQVIETIGLLPVKDLMKIDSAAMEIIMKAGKTFEMASRQSDLSFKQAERAETLSQNLKAITQKLEQFLNKENQKNGKWKQILEKVFYTDVQTKTRNNHLTTNLLYNRNLANERVHHLIPTDLSVGRKVSAEGEQSTKTSVSTPFTGFMGQQMGRAEQFTLFVNKSQQGPTYEQFVKDFANIIGKSQMVQTPNMSKLLIKLYPEQLGSLRIELLQQNGVMTAKILASTKAAKDILDSNLTGLRHALSSQNLQVDKLEIAQTFTESQQRHERQPSQQQNGQHPKGQPEQQPNDKDEAESTFKEFLMNNEI